MTNSFIDSNNNLMFSSLKGIDLQQLLWEIDNFFLYYRDTLDFPDFAQFGVEIEYEDLKKIHVDQFIVENYSCWNSGYDGSLTNGGEIRSPIIKDELRYWKELKDICFFLTKNRANTSDNAGAHVHVGVNILGDDIETWKTFIFFYICYEPILLRFMYGDKVNGRRKILDYACPIADDLFELVPKIQSAKTVQELKFLKSNLFKESLLNILNVDFDDPLDIYKKNTLEFRGNNGTSNEVIWQNYINAETKMLIASRNINIDFLLYKLKNAFISYKKNKYLYSEINLKNALEFVDLNFDNNLDKVYFLRQYLKGWEDSYLIKGPKLSKKFVK